MLRRIKEENRKRYTADFETLTLTPEQIDAGAHTYVWAWALCDCKNPDNVEFGTEIITFFAKIFSLDNWSVVYFHNEKFDGSFILNYLLKNGYKQWTGKKEDMPDKSFICLTTGMGVFYSMTIRNNKHYVEITDSLKKLPFTVEKIAKDLKLPIQKGHIDYDAYRAEGGTLSETDKIYIQYDVQIVAIALQKMYFDNGLYGMTIGADCMKYYKDITKQFGYYYPQLDPKEDQFARFAYRGGYCYLNPKYKNVLINQVGCVYDKNSMYPSQMGTSSISNKCYNNRYPVGKGIYYVGQYIYDNTYNLYIQHIRCAFKVKPGHVPTIQLKNNLLFNQNEYVTDSNDEIQDLYLTSVDLEIFLKHYKPYLYEEGDGLIDYVDGYKYQSVIGLFDKYIKFWYDKKEEATKSGNRFLRQLSKNFLNNLYGKFSTNPNSSYLVFNIGDKGQLVRNAEEDTKDTIYIPVGAFITAYARKDLLNAIQCNYDRFIYADTDSIHLIGDQPAKGIPIDPVKLGCWDRETDWTAAKFLRQKTYAECTQDGWQFKCAGLPKPNDILTIEQFYPGSVIKNAKLMSKQVPGGIVLVPTDFEIKKK